MSGEPCYCGATDCWSCGPAQGYRVEYSPTRGYYNPEDDDEEGMSREDWLAEKADHEYDEAKDRSLTERNW